MRAVLGCAAGLALACGATLAGQAKIDAKFLAGRWEPVPEAEPKPDPKDKKDKKEPKDKPPPGPAMVVEFAADPKTPTEGRMTMTVTDAGKEHRAEGTYKLEGDKLSVQLKLGEREVKETLTITKLTADELVTQDSKNKTESLKRKK